MKIFYLQHSGFVIEFDTRCFIFDYYKDPAGHVQRLANEGKELWFFVTHAHGDHFNRMILNFDRADTKYFIHTDVPLLGKPQGDLFKMNVGEDLSIDGIHITMYGSTDEGGSFFVDDGVHKVFHAGDLNWWHWAEDTPENIRFARQFAEKEFARIQGMHADIVFFPVDARLEKAREWGAIEFLKVATVNTLFIPMHNNGPVWEPSSYFKSHFGGVPLWIPQQDGDSISI